MRQIKINSTTGVELISLSLAKSYLRVDVTTDDTLIGEMISQARLWCENYISRDIVSKTRSYYLSKTDGVIDIPFAPVASIQSVTVEGTSSTFEIKGLNKERIELKNLENVLIGYQDGYAKDVIINYTTAGLNDALLRQAMLQLVSTYYDNRADFVIGSAINDIPTNVKSILSSFKTSFILCSQENSIRGLALKGQLR